MSDSLKTPSLPLGPLVEAGGAQRPERIAMNGRYVRLEPVDPHRHGDDLYEAAGGAATDHLWTYLSTGPFTGRDEFDAYLAKMAQSSDPLMYAIVDRKTGKASGHASYLRIEPTHRVIEVGNILFGPALQKTPGATEAMYLMADYVFDQLGYRRYEWKCNALNEPSRRAALRLGFQFEGIFRQHMIIKGRNRDTAWFSLLDEEWPEAKRAMECWLDDSNFDATGRQRRTLAAIRRNG